VRYMVNDVDAAVDFYVSELGFELNQQFGKAIAILVHGGLMSASAHGRYPIRTRSLSRGRR
jgi:catechol 2,3-dioxygenase-like lactoylglutathione lyase family enzyme